MSEQESRERLKLGPDSRVESTGERMVAEQTAGRGPVVHPLIYDLMVEVERQDAKHGPYQGSILGRSRLALATLEDEVAEALKAWRDERKATHWKETRAEVLQVAAVAIRTLRDAL